VSDDLAAVRRDAELAAEEARSSRLPAGFEQELDAVWAELAADPASLVAGETHAPAPAVEAGPVGRLLGRSAVEGARRAGRIALRRAKVAAGPSYRAGRRAAGELAGRLGETAATRYEVALDQARQAGRDRSALRRLAAHAPSSRAFEPSRRPDAVEWDEELLDWVLERVTRNSPGGLAVHVECGSGRLVERLEEAGFSARGADPGARGASDDGRIAVGGAVGYLGRLRPASLDVLVLSGATDRMTPRSARALVQLAATRLRPGGRLAVLSSRPAAFEATDPVRSDLGPGRPLHPVTWCHLLARYGFVEVTVHDAAGDSAYAVSASRP
jgi:hypothetical protein